MQEKTQNTKNWFSRPRKQRNYVAAHAFEIDASFSCLLTVFLSQAAKEPGNNSLLFPQVKKREVCIRAKWSIRPQLIPVSSFHRQTRNYF